MMIWIKHSRIEGNYFCVNLNWSWKQRRSSGSLPKRGVRMLRMKPVNTGKLHENQIHNGMENYCEKKKKYVNLAIKEEMY